MVKQLKKIKSLCFIAAVFRGFFRKSYIFFLLCKMRLMGLFLTYDRPDVTVVGYIKEAGGIGRLPIEVIDSLSDDFSINFLNTRACHFADVSSKVKNIAKRPFHVFGKNILFQDAPVQIGFYLYKMLGKKRQDDQVRIAHSMFETTQIPHEWVGALNSHFDCVVVPDPFLVKVYQNSGVKLPIFTIPLGLAHLDQYVQKPLKNHANHPFVFANYGSISARKNQMTIIRAFAQAFGNSDQVFLKIQGRYFDSAVLAEMQNEVLISKLQNVTIFTKCLSQEEYFKAFCNIDCYVNLSFGEGFSIQPREAMALGLPVILSDNTAQSTMCRSGLVESVPAPILQAAMYSDGKRYGDYYSCTIQDAADAMKRVYSNYEHHLKKADLRRRWASKYQQKNITPLYKTLIKPKKVALAEENHIDAECLTTNSKSLFLKQVSRI